MEVKRREKDSMKRKHHNQRNIKIDVKDRNKNRNPRNRTWTAI
jgi:hypothetical protein